MIDIITDSQIEQHFKKAKTHLNKLSNRVPL